MIAELDRARDALYAIDPGCDRETWVKIAMGAKAAGLPIDTFIDWSSTAGNFSGEADCRSVWKSINGSGGIGPATLFGMARDVGWRDETSGHDRTHQKPQEAPKPRPKVQSPAFDFAAVWRDSEPATAVHPYIDRKLGLPDGCRVYSGSLAVAGQALDGALLVPVHDADGKLQSWQGIPATGDKRSAPGAPIRGGRFIVGGDIEDVAYIAEGIGQAWSAHQASGKPAVCCFGAGNVEAVAVQLREQFPGARLVIVADAGKDSDAQRIATKVGGAWVGMPTGSPDNFDLNDFHQQAGELKAVAELLAGAVESNDGDRLQPIDFTDLDTNPPPPRRWGWHGWIPAGTVTLLAGGAGVGKTLLSQQIANLFSVGGTLFGSEVSQGPVCGIFCEDDADELRRRQVRILRWLGRSAAYSSSGLHLVPRVGFDNALIAFGADRRMQRTELLADLMRLAESTRAALVIVDNIAQVFAGSENDRHEVSAFCGALAEICTRTGAAVLLLGHPAKAIGSEYSGSTAWEAAVRTRLFLDRRDDGLLELRRAKANYASTGDTVVLTYDEGVFREADPADTSSAEAQAAEATVVEALRRFTQQEMATSHHPSSRTNLILLAMKDGLLPGIRKEIGMRALAALIDRGEIEPNADLPWRNSQRRKAIGLAIKEGKPCV